MPEKKPIKTVGKKPAEKKEKKESKTDIKSKQADEIIKFCKEKKFGRKSLCFAKRLAYTEDALGD